MRKLLSFFRPKYCVVDLKSIGGGFVGETFNVVYRGCFFPTQRHIEITEHSHATCQIMDSSIISKHYSEKSVYRKLMGLVQHDYTLKILEGLPIPPGKLMAVCEITYYHTGGERVAIRKIAMTQILDKLPAGEAYKDELFTVIPEASFKDLVFNIWCSVEKAQEYLSRLHGCYKIVSY